MFQDSWEESCDRKNVQQRAVASDHGEDDEDDEHDEDDDDDDDEEEEEEDEEGEHSIWKQTGSVKSKPVKCLFTYPTDAPLLVINWVTTPLKGL